MERLLAIKQRLAFCCYAIAVDRKKDVELMVGFSAEIYETGPSVAAALESAVVFIYIAVDSRSCLIF